MTATTAHYVRIAPGNPLPDIDRFAPFKAVVVLETSYTQEWQNQVSDWLVKSGCRYMMAWGPDCTTWDDSVDWADLDARNFEEDDSKFVMTTWHENNTLEDVFWQAQFVAQTSYDDVELTNALIMHVSAIDRHEWMMALFERSTTLAEREPD